MYDIISPYIFPSKGIDISETTGLIAMKFTAYIKLINRNLNIKFEANLKFFIDLIILNFKSHSRS